MTIVIRRLFGALAMLVLIVSAVRAQTPQPFNVLDQVEYDPRTQKISLAGHYDPAYGDRQIPYLDYLATFLDYPTPAFSLDPPAEARAAWIELNKRLKSEEEWKKIVGEWGPWIDDKGALTPTGRSFLNAFGVNPPAGPAEKSDNPWSTSDRYQILARIFAGAGNERAAKIVDALGKAYRALPNITQDMLKELLAAAGVMDEFNRNAAAVKEGKITDAQGLAKTYRTFFESIERSFALASAPATAAFDVAIADKKPVPESIEIGLREFDRQFQTVYQLALVKLWESRDEIHIQLTDFTPSLRNQAMITLVFHNLPRNSLLAKLMFESDYFLKYLTRMPQLTQKIPNFQTEYSFAKGKTDPDTKSNRRTWISVDYIEAARSPSNNILAISDVKMRINIRRTDSVTGDDLPDQEPGEYETLLTSLYEDFSRAFPHVFHELREAGKLSYAAQWLKTKNARLKLPEAQRAVWNGPSQIPSLLFVVQAPKRLDPGTDASSVSISGGVELQAPKPSGDKLPSNSSVNPAAGRTGCKPGTAPGGAMTGSGGANAVLIDCNEFGRPIDFKFFRDQNPKPGQAKAGGPDTPGGKKPSGGKPQQTPAPAPPSAGDNTPPAPPVAAAPPPPPPKPPAPPVAAAPPPPPPPPSPKQASKDDCKSRAGTAFFGQQANPEGVNLCDDPAPPVDLSKTVPLLREPEPEVKRVHSPPPGPCDIMQAEINDLTDAIPRARLAQDAYFPHDPKSSGAPAGFEVLSNDMKELRKLLPDLSEERIKRLINPDKSEYRAVIYRDKITNKVFLAFRGTTEAAADWCQGNFPQAQGVRSEYYENAKRLGAELEKTLGAQNRGFEVIGHSLGGGMAAAATLAAVQACGNKPICNVKGTTFNASGLHQSTLPGFKMSDAARYIDSFVLDGEPLNTLQDNRDKTIGGLANAAEALQHVPINPVLRALAGGYLQAKINEYGYNTCLPPEAQKNLPQWIRDQGALNDALPPSVGHRITIPPNDGSAGKLSIDRHIIRNVRIAIDDRLRKLKKEYTKQCVRGGAPSTSNSPDKPKIAVKIPKEVIDLIDKKVNWPNALWDFVQLKKPRKDWSADERLMFNADAQNLKNAQRVMTELKELGLSEGDLAELLKTAMIKNSLDAFRSGEAKTADLYRQARSDGIKGHTGMLGDKVATTAAEWAVRYCPDLVTCRPLAATYLLARKGPEAVKETIEHGVEGAKYIAESFHKRIELGRERTKNQSGDPLAPIPGTPAWVRQQSAPPPAGATPPQGTPPAAPKPIEPLEKRAEKFIESGKTATAVGKFPFEVKETVEFGDKILDVGKAFKAEGATGVANLARDLANKVPETPSTLSRVGSGISTGLGTAKDVLDIADRGLKKDWAGAAQAGGHLAGDIATIAGKKYGGLITSGTDTLKSTGDLWSAARLKPPVQGPAAAQLQTTYENRDSAQRLYHQLTSGGPVTIESYAPGP